MFFLLHLKKFWKLNSNKNNVNEVKVFISYKIPIAKYFGSNKKNDPESLNK